MNPTLYITSPNLPSNPYLDFIPHTTKIATKYLPSNFGNPTIHKTTKTTIKIDLKDFIHNACPTQIQQLYQLVLSLPSTFTTTWLKTKNTTFTTLSQIAQYLKTLLKLYFPQYL